MLGLLHVTKEGDKQISNEIDKHKVLLTNLENSIDSTQNRFVRATKKLDKFA